MKLRRLFFLSAVATALMSQAVEPAAQLFAAMPDSLIPSLEVNRRKDLIDLFHAGQSAQVTTKLGGQAQMTQLQEQSLVIDLSEQSRMALYLYTTTGNDSVVALVNTVYAPAGDSRIRFFNSAWRELPASKYIEQPTRDDFFLFPDSLSKAQREELMQATEICLVEYTFEPDGSICARQSWEKYLDRETYNRLKPYLRESITLRWNGKNFKE